MDLPPELLDEIISYIPPDDHQSLRNCSLVAKSWIYPSRRRIFKTVIIWRETRLKSWLDVISPANVEVSQHIRSLTCKIANPPDSSRPSIKLLNDYLPSFGQLEHLIFFLGFLPPLTRIGACSAFQHTLSHLSLRCCKVTVNGVVTFVNYFHNLAHLELADLSRIKDDQPAPPFSRPLQKLTVMELCTDSALIVLDQLMGLRPQCEEVAISIYWASCPTLAQRVIDGVEASVKRLNLNSNLAGVFGIAEMCSEEF